MKKSKNKKPLSPKREIRVSEGTYESGAKLWRVSELGSANVGVFPQRMYTKEKAVAKFIGHNQKTPVTSVVTIKTVSYTPEPKKILDKPTKSSLHKMAKAASVPHKEIKHERPKTSLAPKKKEKSNGKRPLKYGDYKLTKLLVLKVAPHEKEWLKEQAKGHRGGVAEFIRAKLGLMPVK